MNLFSRAGMMQFMVQLSMIILLGFVKNGNAGITSSYVRTPFPSKDIPLDNPLLAPPPGQNAPEQVHITQGDFNGKAVIVTWVTPNATKTSTVKYGLSSGKYISNCNGTSKNYSFYNYQSGYIHQCRLDNLQYDTKYYYRVEDDIFTFTVREFWFQTPPEINPDQSYTFGIIGDLGQTFNSLATLRHFMESKADALLFLGDLSYADTYYKTPDQIGVRWDSWGRLVENSTAYVPWFWSVGNHEIEYFPSILNGSQPETPFKNYLHRYPTPYYASDSNSPLWYSVRRASAHIIVLNSYSGFSMYTPQYIWLSLELEYKVNREETPWLIVVVHAPLYSSNEAHFMEGESMRAELEKWFIKYRVDVVFSGHVHAYERMHRVSNLRDDISTGNCHPIRDRAAPVYINVGDGGNREGLAAFYREPQPHYSAFREASFGHGKLEITNRTHAFFTWHRNDDGQNVVADSFVLHNQYWAGTKLKKYNMIKSVIDEAPGKN